MNALHSSSWDDPRPYFGFEVALRFLSPTHQMYGVTPRVFHAYLRQPHKQKLLNWGEYRWEGDCTIIDNEAYQQVSVRTGPDDPWTSVRWMLVRIEPGASPHSQWAVDAVFVSEPDDGALDPSEWSTAVVPLPPGEAQNLFSEFDADGSGSISIIEFRQAVARLGIARSEAELAEVVDAIDADRSGEIDFDEFDSLLAMVNKQCAVGRLAQELTAAKRETETSEDVAGKVLRALQQPDEPYPLHGSEVAIRYCSPTNRASRLSPQAFSQYLREPWYEILTEWDEIEIEEAEETESGVVSQDVLVKRSEDDSWSVVNMQMSRHNGRWLMDSLTIS